MRISKYNETLAKTIAALDESNLILVHDASELLNHHDQSSPIASESTFILYPPHRHLAAQNSSERVTEGQKSRESGNQHFQRPETEL